MARLWQNAQASPYEGAEEAVVSGPLIGDVARSRRKKTVVVVRDKFLKIAE